jgi:hypothetical protein
VCSVVNGDFGPLLFYYSKNPNNTNLYTMEHKFEFETFDLGEITKMQAKINQWITIGKLINHKIIVLSERKLLVQYTVHK